MVESVTIASDLKKLETDFHNSQLEYAKNMGMNGHILERLNDIKEALNKIEADNKHSIKNITQEYRTEIEGLKDRLSDVERQLADWQIGWNTIKKTARTQWLMIGGCFTVLAATSTFHLPKFFIN